MYGLIFLSMDTFIYRNNDERKSYEKRQIGFSFEGMQAIVFFLTAIQMKILPL